MSTVQGTMKNTFMKQVRVLRDAMPSHKFQATTIGGINYITCKPLTNLVLSSELIMAGRLGLNYITNRNEFISSELKGNYSKLYK